MPRYKIQVHLETQVDCCQPGYMGSDYQTYKETELTSEICTVSNPVTSPTLGGILDNQVMVFNNGNQEKVYQIQTIFHKFQEDYSVVRLKDVIMQCSKESVADKTFDELLQEYSFIEKL